MKTKGGDSGQAVDKLFLSKPIGMQVIIPEKGGRWLLLGEGGLIPAYLSKNPNTASCVTLLEDRKGLFRVEITAV